MKGSSCVCKEDVAHTRIFDRFGHMSVIVLIYASSVLVEDYGFE